MANQTGLSFPPNIDFFNGFDSANPLDQLRIYDELIVKWLCSFCHPQVKKGNPLYLQFATAERGYAEIRNLDNRDKPDYQRNRDPIAKPLLPAIEVTRRGPIPDYTRQKTRVRIVGNFVDDTDKKKRYVSHYPKPYNLPYQIDFVSINRKTMNLIQTYFMLQYEDDRFLLIADFTKIHKIFGKLFIPVVLSDFIDNSDLEPGENEREIRVTMDVSVSAWFFRPVKEVETVQGFQFDIFNGLEETNELGQSNLCEKMTVEFVPEFKITTEPP